VLKLAMLIIPFTKTNAQSIFAKSSEILKGGGIVAYPTESFYALGVAATDEYAVKKLIGLKRRPADKPLPVIVGDLAVLESIVRRVPSHAEKLIRRFWPGPLTILFEAKDNVPVLLTGIKGKVAVRVPGESIALHLAITLNIPVTSTSANPSGSPPAVDAAAVANYFGDDIDLIIDGGRTPGGKPSTIVDVTVDPPKVLREGAVSL